MLHVWNKFWWILLIVEVWMEKKHRIFSFAWIESKNFRIQCQSWLKNSFSTFGPFVFGNSLDEMEIEVKILNFCVCHNSPALDIIMTMPHKFNIRMALYSLHSQRTTTIHLEKANQRFAQKIHNVVSSLRHWKHDKIQMKFYKCIRPKFNWND